MNLLNSDFPTRREAGRRMIGTAVAVLCAGRGGPAQAAALPEPSGDVLLRVKGATPLGQTPGEARFDFAALERLPQHEFTTRTPWHNDRQTYSGPLLRHVMGATGARGHTLKALALNAYTVRIPWEDQNEFALLLATRRNGERLRVRDRGPLLLVYPFDTDTRLSDQRYYARSVWQLTELTVEA